MLLNLMRITVFVLSRARQGNKADYIV